MFLLKAEKEPLYKTKIKTALHFIRKGDTKPKGIWSQLSQFHVILEGLSDVLYIHKKQSAWFRAEALTKLQPQHCKFAANSTE